jgi:cell division protein FtsI/penicillin-binding protein 2
MALIVLFSFATVSVRLYRLQVVEHDRYLEEALITRYGTASVPAPRGVITDATGYPLATSIPTWDVYIDRFQWRDRDEASRSAIGMGAELDRDADELYARGTEYDTGDYLVLRDLGYKEGLALQARGLLGVRLLPSAVRQYPEGDLARQVIGHVGIDGTGLWGVEADYDHLLRGQPGLMSSEHSALGRPIAFTTGTEHRPVDGDEVQLTIDRFIQAIIDRELADALERYEAPSGSILVMDPRTGAILAMASRPSTGITSDALDNPDLPNLVRNRPMTDLYEPGSVLKTLTTAMALDQGLVTAESTYVDEGSVTVGTSVIRNWDFQAYGTVTVREYLQRSLNTGAVWLSQEIGAETFYEYLLDFGLGEPTHLGLSGEAEGMVRLPVDEEWYPVDLATNSYGQGLAATPLQVLTAVNVFANDGWLMRPYVVSQIVSDKEVRQFEPVQVRQVVSSRTATAMAALMRDVVNGTEWHGARLSNYMVAGKTGTTIVSIPTGYDFDTTIASFAGFLPYEAPQISVLVKIDMPGGDLRLGGQVAAPVFARVAVEIMEYLWVPPSSGLVVQP